VEKQKKYISFVRHGQTKWNKLGKTQDQEEDIELNETAKMQSKKQVNILKNLELLKKVNFIVNYIKISKCTKFLVVTHSGLLDILLKTIFNQGIIFLWVI